MIKLELTFATEAELLAFFAHRTAPAVRTTLAPVTPAPVALTAPTPPTAVVAPPPAAAPETKATPTVEPAATKVEKVYTPADVSQAVSGYLGAAPAADASDEVRSTYAARRAAMVALLATYGVKKGSDLREDQRGLFVLEVADLPT